MRQRRIRLEDHKEMGRHYKNGDSVKCWVCGKDATTTRPVKMYQVGYMFEPPLSNYRRCYCDECLKKEQKEEAEEKALFVKLRKREMIRKACSILEAQNTDMYEYKEAIDVVKDFVEDNVDKIDSSYEALAAIVLVKNRIYSKMQYRVGPYQVDFLLPDLMVVLEIDGERHKHRKEYDSARDKFIKKELGPHWEIIRIDTDNLDKNAKKLPKAIDKVLEYRETKHINWRDL